MGPATAGRPALRLRAIWRRNNVCAAHRMVAGEQILCFGRLLDAFVSIDILWELCCTFPEDATVS